MAKAPVTLRQCRPTWSDVNQGGSCPRHWNSWSAWAKEKSSSASLKAQSWTVRGQAVFLKLISGCWIMPAKSDWVPGSYTIKVLTRFFHRNVSLSKYGLFFGAFLVCGIWALFKKNWRKLFWLGCASNERINFTFQNRKTFKTVC